MTPQEQFLDMLANTRPIRGVAIREVAGGYNITGSTRYADKVTGGIQHEQNEEGIAVDARTAVGMAGNYLVSGELQPVPTPINIDQMTMLLQGGTLQVQTPTQQTNTVEQQAVI